MRMPILPVETMLEGCRGCDEETLVKKCFARGRLRATKPCRNPGNILDASANYVWRMLAFDYAGFRPHNCMPITADFDVCKEISRRYRNPKFDDPLREVCRNEQKKQVAYLDDLIKRIEATIPVTMQRGAMQWAKAFGVV